MSSVGGPRSSIDDNFLPLLSRMGSSHELPNDDVNNNIPTMPFWMRISGKKTLSSSATSTVTSSSCIPARKMSSFPHNQQPSSIVDEPPPRKIKKKSSTVWHNRPTTHISALYPELLSTIFEFLDVPDKGSAAQVCTTWRDAAYRKSVWRGVEAKLHLRRPNPTLFPSLVRRGIKRVQVSCIQRLWYDSSPSVMSVKMALTFPFSFSHFDQQVLSLQKNLKEVTANMPGHLESLVLSGCYNLTDDKIAPAFSPGVDVSSLTSLNLSMCKKIGDHSIYKICTSSTAGSLISLDLGGCSSISDLSLVYIEKHLKRLKSLNLRSCRGIKDSGIAILSGVCTTTSKLQPTSPRQQNQQPIPSPAEGSSSSTSSSNNEQPDQQSKQQDKKPERGLISLEHLSLQDCSISDDALKYISVGLRNLKSINLSFPCTFTTNSPTFTEFGLKFLSAISSLREINLRSCDNVSDVGLRYLAEGGVVLHSLDISFCDKITDQGLEYLSRGLPEIQELSLNSCAITDEGLVKVAATMTELKTLNIGQCSRITDRGVNAIIDGCPQLSNLDIYGCPRITTPTIERLMSSNVQLSRDLFPDRGLVTTSVQEEDEDNQPPSSLKIAGGNWLFPHPFFSGHLNPIPAHQNHLLNHHNHHQQSPFSHLNHHHHLLPPASSSHLLPQQRQPKSGSSGGNHLEEFLKQLHQVALNYSVHVWLQTKHWNC